MTNGSSQGPGSDNYGVSYDVAIVGGGAAGLNAALTLARARRSVLVVDSGQARNAPAGHVHNYLGREGTSPAELYRDGRLEVIGYGGQIVEGTVTGVQRDDDGMFRLEAAGSSTSHSTPARRVIRARRLLVTTGLVDQLPDIEGLAERWGKDVLHCPYCHGWEVRDQAIGIIATNLTIAMHQALLWRQWSDDVVLFLHTAQEPSADQLEELAARGIPVVMGEVAAVESGANGLTGVRLRSGQMVPRQAVAIMTRLEARAGFLADLGLVASEQYVGDVSIGTAIPAGPTGATDVPGVYVAGNVTNPMAQVIVAAGAGLGAGAAINADLMAEDTRNAVEHYRLGQPSHSMQ